MITQLARHVNQFSALPKELYPYPQWVNWKLHDGKKIPYNPKVAIFASPTQARTWGSFPQAMKSYAMKQGDVDGIGFVFTQDDPYSFIDLDHCIVDGRINSQAREIMARFPQAYTEISPSGNGLKLVLMGKLPQGNRRTTGLEVYDRERYSTLTGQALIVPNRLKDYQAELGVWFAEAFPIADTAPMIDGEMSPKLRNGDVLNLAKRRKGFEALWKGDITRYDSDDSRADMALCGYLSFYTQDPEQIEQLMRQSGLMRDKWDIHPTYLLDTILKAIVRRTGTYSPRTDRREYYAAPSYGLPMPEVREQFKATLEATSGVDGEATLYMSPPGTGKTHIAAEYFKDKNVSWAAESHSMTLQVPALKEYHHTQPCTSENCADPQLHKDLSELGYSAFYLHKNHDCAYGHQFHRKGSTVYMREYAPTSYMTNHDIHVIDEFNPSGWIHTRVITRKTIIKVRGNTRTDGRAGVLLKAFLDVMSDAPLYGKRLYDALAEQVGGIDALFALVNDLACDEQIMTTHPQPTTAVVMLAPIIVPYIVAVLRDELPLWDGRNEFNSVMRISHDETVRILEPRRFPDNKPLVILDATGEATITSRLLARKVNAVRYEVRPPKGMQHVRVALKRYSKNALIDWRSSEPAYKRLVKEIRHVLASKGITDMRKVGLITFKGLEDRLAKELGISKKGHFGNIRGSNAYEQCEVLLVVGTPCPNLNEVEWFARMLYRDDPKPIMTDKDEKYQYTDVRLKGLLEYLIKAELTQAAHRNRPLVHEGRMVISFSSADIDFLPVTEDITQLPNL